MNRFFLTLATLSLLLTGSVFADGPADNKIENVRRIPPLGVEVPETEATELRAKLDAVAAEIATLKKELAKSPEFLELIPDVEVFHRAARCALEYQEFQKPAEIKLALAQLDAALERVASLRKKEAPWLKQTGPVVRGFRSKLDGTVQPYGVDIPENYTFTGQDEWRLDFWFHGRGEKTNEVAFINGRQRGGGGKLNPKNAIILYPYARFSNANKFAGEIDCLEALEHVKGFLRVDEGRIVNRGFSMGGAACWQFAVHYADQFVAATPGAGFSETPDFLRTFQGETLDPKPWEKTLWRWYDCTDWIANLSNLPVIAYSGELDKQKQAADMMAAAYQKEGMEMVHIIGPKMAHAMDNDSMAEIERRLETIVKAGRNRVPHVVRFKTYTLRYNRMHWITVDALTEHWEPATISAAFTPPNSIKVNPEGVDRFTIEFAPGDCPVPIGFPVIVQFPNGGGPCPSVLSDGSWKCTFQRNGQKWDIVANPAETTGLRKRHGLSGPIDDAFMDSFMMVTPTGHPLNTDVKKWTDSEFDHGVTHWRQQMRGDARVKADTEISEDDIANHNLVLWGDPKSNAVLAKIIDQLPITWNEKKLKIGDQTYDSSKHAIAMIFPNPLNPKRYVVLNSSFTYREYDYLNNARQTPKLPDWAIIDFTKPSNSRWPGGIPAAGFFDEGWGVK